MGLLHDIQKDLISDVSEIKILLKLRLLASQLGSVELEDWVRYESEGYPKNVPVPEYRRLGVSHTASFNGPFGSGIQNAPIPSGLIAEFAGKEWVTLELRQSIASVDELLGDPADRSRSVSLNRSDLILALQGNVYADYACNSVIGHISKSALTELKNAVRTKIIELTIAFEKSVPEAASITLGPLEDALPIDRSDKVTSITHQVIHGNVTTINTKGDHNSFQVEVRQGDSNAVSKTLVDAGIDASDAKEFASVLASERGGTPSEPLGQRAGDWLVQNLKKAATGAWNIGVSAASTVITEAAKRYYGL